MGPRNKDIDKLVTLKLLSYTYLQIGIIQAIAGFFCFFTVLADCGFKTGMLFGLRTSWDDDNLESLTDSYGQEWTYKSRFAVLNSGQTSYFVSIVIVQWADLLICKTRIQSLWTQGMRNWVMTRPLSSRRALLSSSLTAQASTHSSRRGLLPLGGGCQRAHSRSSSSSTTSSVRKRSGSTVMPSKPETPKRVSLTGRNLDGRIHNRVGSNRSLTIRFVQSVVRRTTMEVWRLESNGMEMPTVCVCSLHLFLEMY